MTTPKFKNGVLVKKREKKDTVYQNDFGRIGTVIKTEKRDQKRKGRIEPQKVFYCEVLWRGRDKTEWVFQNRLERVEGI